MSSNLKAKTLSGMIWSFMQRFGTMAISFVSNIVLARLLTPDDYGVIGMLAIFIAISNTFIDGGFGSALIQKKEPTKEDYSTIFWWNMFLSIVLYGVLYLCAPLIANFYNLPLLADVLRVQGVVLIINALSIIQQNQLRKQLKFKRLATVTVISATLSAGIAIVLAWQGWGLWALVAQQILLSTFTAIILWFLNKWYPSLVFSRESFKQLFSFGGFILASNLVNTFCDNVQGLLLGKFANPSTLGLYTQARKLEDIATTSISTVVNQVAYPVLSQNQDNVELLIKTLKKFITFIAFLVFPLMFLLILVAKPVIIAIYSYKWIECVPYFQILCIAGLAISLQSININAIAAIGKSSILFKWTIIKRGIGLIINIVGFFTFGIYGLLFGGVLTSFVLYFINAQLVSKYVGYKFKQQMSDLIPILASVLIAFLSSKTIDYLISINIYIKALLQILMFVGIYFFMTKILCSKITIEFKNTLFSVIKRN